MQINKFREVPPIRTYNGCQLSPYRKYKIFLHKDFNARCAYTDCPEHWFGGKRNFHIDHVKPKVHYPKLECVYSNLVYSCSYVNQKKSKYNGDFLDPCDTDYNEHFFRDEYGNIYAKKGSLIAEKMSKIMGLSLRRYGLIWQLEKLNKKIEELNRVIEGLDEQNPKLLPLLKEYRLANEEFKKYFKFLGAEL